MSYKRLFRELEYLICKIVMAELHLLNYPVDYNKELLLPTILADARFTTLQEEFVEEFAIHVVLEVENNLIDITLLKDDGLQLL